MLMVLKGEKRKKKQQLYNKLTWDIWCKSFDYPQKFKEIVQSKKK